MISVSINLMRENHMKPELFKKKPKIKQKHIFFGAVAVLAIFVLVFSMKDENRYSQQYRSCINTMKILENSPKTAGKFWANCEQYK